MKTIQNKALANTDLMLGKELVRGDSEGRFDVSDEMADMLTKTPGWELSVTVKESAKDPVARLRQVAEGAKPKAPAPPAPAATRSPRAVRAPAADVPAGAPAEPAAATPPPAAPETPTEPEQPAEGAPTADDGPDLSTLDAAGLIKVAEEYGIKLTKARREGPVEELRKYLDEQLYEPEPASPT